MDLRRIVTHLRYQWLWLLTAFILAIITLDSLAELPHGAKFLYPLRDLYFQIRAWAYTPLRLITLVTASLSLPYVISSRIAMLDQEGRFGRHTIPRMRPFLALLAISVIGFWVMSDDDARPQTLDKTTFDGNQYVLVWQDRGIQLDYYHLYECDKRGILCEVLFTHVESEDTLDIVMMVTDNRLNVLIEGTIAYHVPE